VAGGALCQPCSLVARAERVFTREEALTAIGAWAAEAGEPPRAADWQTQKLGGAAKWTMEHPRFPSTGMVARLFGSWEAAQRAAGFTPRRRRWTKPAVIDALRRDAQRRGHPPFYAEWQGRPIRPRTLPPPSRCSERGAPRSRRQACVAGLRPRQLRQAQARSARAAHLGAHERDHTPVEPARSRGD
jgi:hypothetical protein